MKRQSPYVFYCVVICLASASLTGWHKMRSGSGIALGAQVKARAVSWIPYQISYKQYGSEPDYSKKAEGTGKLLVLADIVRAVRSDGSQAEWETAYRADGSVDYRYRTITLSDGVRVRANETVGLMTAIKKPTLPSVLARQALDPSKSCAGSYDGSRPSQNMLISREKLFGYETHKIFIDMGLARRTVWRAPALGCAELRDLFEKLDPQSGRVLAVGDRVATDIRQGEPDAVLFQMPAGLLNVPPSELAAAQSAINGERPSASQLQAIAPWDEEFKKLRFDP